MNGSRYVRDKGLTMAGAELLFLFPGTCLTNRPHALLCAIYSEGARPGPGSPAPPVGRDGKNRAAGAGRAVVSRAGGCPLAGRREDSQLTAAEPGWHHMDQEPGTSVLWVRWPRPRAKPTCQNRFSQFMVGLGSASRCLNPSTTSGLLSTEVDMPSEGFLLIEEFGKDCVRDPTFITLNN